MRRRALAAEVAQAAGGEPPAELQSMRGVTRFHAAAAAGPAPEWVQPGEVEQWRRGQAYGLWGRARRDWCEANGRDFVATFHPGWLERRR